MTESERDNLPFSIGAVISSIQAGLPLIKAVEENSFRRKLDRIKTQFVGFVAILFAYASLIKDSKVLVPEQITWLRNFFVFVQEQFGIAFICMALLIWFLQALLSVDFAQRDAVSKTSSRLALAFRVRNYAVFEMLVGVLTLLLALLIVAWMMYSTLSGPGAQ